MSRQAPEHPVGDSVAKINDEVAVGEDLAFQRKWWRFEKGAWIFFTLVIGLDMAGLFGRGPLANARQTATDNSLDVRYERIERTGTPSMMKVSVDPGSVRDGSVQLYVSDSLIGPLGTQRVIPQPAAARAGDGGLIYTFPIGAPPAVIRFEMQPAEIGFHEFTMSVEGRRPVSASIFVVP